MRFSSTILLFSLTLPIPGFAAPPADVDAALRDRIQQFYQLQVDHKFRQAESLVAEDSKDYYYDTQKPELHDFKLEIIKYLPDGHSADVTVVTKMTMRILGARPAVVDFPLHSKWKLDGGKWCWYVDTSGIDTPFGRMKVSDGVGGGLADLSKAPGRGTVANLENGVQPDTHKLLIDPRSSKPVTMTLKNTLPGTVSLAVEGESPALKVEIAKPNLGALESTQVTVTPVPGSSDRPTKLILRVMPTGQPIQIDLDYSPAK